MARSTARTRAKADQPAESTVTSTINETPEETVTVTTTTEPEAQATEAAAAETTESTEKPAETPIDLSSFISAVDAAVAERDTSTGTLPAEQVESVKAAYRDLDTVKAKNAARKTMQDRLKEAVGKLDVVLGKAVMELAESLSTATSGGGSSASREPKAPADPAAAFKLRLTAAHLAYTLVANDVPEGVDGDKILAEVGDDINELADAANAYYAWLIDASEEKGDEPEVAPSVKMAAKLALGKSARSGSTRKATVSSGARGNVLKHILTVMEDVEPGKFLLIREIAQAKSPEYPEGDVSPGAISARLFPSDGKEVHADLLAVVTPGENDKGKKGATKN